MNRKWSFLSIFFAAGFVFVSLQAMEPTQPMDLDPLEPMEIYQPPAVEPQTMQPAAQQGAAQAQEVVEGQPGGPEETALHETIIGPLMIDAIALNWIQRHDTLRDVAVQVRHAYGREIGAAVATRIREIVETSIILENNSDRVATVTIDIQITGVEPIQVELTSQERIVLPLPENLQIGLRMGMRMHITASLAVAPTAAPRAFRQNVMVTGGARIIITNTGMTVKNIIQPTLPPLRRQNARRNLFGPE